MCCCIYLNLKSDIGYSTFCFLFHFSTLFSFICHCLHVSPSPPLLTLPVSHFPTFSWTVRWNHYIWISGRHKHKATNYIYCACFHSSSSHHFPQHMASFFSHMRIHMSPRHFSLHTAAVPHSQFEVQLLNLPMQTAAAEHYSHPCESPLSSKPVSA